MNNHPPCSAWADKLALRREDLSQAEREALDAHVATCTACRRAQADYYLLDSALRALPDLTVTLMLRPSFPESSGDLARLVVNEKFPFGRRIFLPNKKREGIHPPLFIPQWLVIASIVVIIAVITSILSPTFQNAQAASLSLRKALVKPQPGATWVHAVSWSPNGKYIAVLWDDSTMQVLDANTGEEIFSQNAGWGYGLSWSPDSQYLASVGMENNTIEIWNISTHKCETNALHQCLIYTQHTALVEAIAWSPDGSLIASASNDGTIQIWDASTMKRLTLYQDNPYSQVTAVAWSPDGKSLVSGDSDGHVWTLNAHSGQPLASYSGHKGAITSVSWSSDGASIASSSYDGTIRIWNVITGVSASPLVPSKGEPVFAAIWTPQKDSIYLALACYDGSVQVWSVVHGQGEPVATYGKGLLNGVFTISWSPQGNQIITGGPGNILTFRLG